MAKKRPSAALVKAQAALKAARARARKAGGALASRGKQELSERVVPAAVNAGAAAAAGLAVSAAATALQRRSSRGPYTAAGIAGAAAILGPALGLTTPVATAALHGAAGAAAAVAWRHRQATAPQLSAEPEAWLQDPWEGPEISAFDDENAYDDDEEDDGGVL